MFIYKVDDPGKNGESPLSTACKNGNIAMTELLLKEKADPKPADKSGKCFVDNSLWWREFNFLDGIPSGILFHFVATVALCHYIELT